MLEEFKKFALRGNAVDLAIGVIIGAAFGAIVNSLVGDILSPIIGAVSGGFDFTNHFLPLSSKVTADSLAKARTRRRAGVAKFLTGLINFVIIAWVLFIVVKVMNQIIHSEPQAPPEQAGNAAHRNPRSAQARPRAIRSDERRSGPDREERRRHSAAADGIRRHVEETAPAAGKWQAHAGRWRQLRGLTPQSGLPDLWRSKVRRWPRNRTARTFKSSRKTARHASITRSARPSRPASRSPARR